MSAKVFRSKHAKAVLTPSVNLRNTGAAAYPTRLCIAV